MNTKPPKDDKSQPLPRQERKRRVSTAWLVTLWSIALLCSFAIASNVCVAVLLRVLTPLFPELRWKFPPIRCLPLVFVLVWSSGVLLVGWIHRSWKVVGYVATVGALMLIFGPCLYFITMLAMFGGYSGPQGG
jgi:hypothetical protein